MTGVLLVSTTNAVGLLYLLSREPEAPATRPDAVQQKDRAESARQITMLAEALRTSATPPPAPAATPEPIEAASTGANVAGVSSVQAPRPSVSEIARDVFDHERRDAAWARDVEQRFRSRVESSEYDATVNRLECGSTRCAILLTTPDKAIFGDIPDWFGPGRLTFEAKATAHGYEYQAVFSRADTTRNDD